MAVRGASAFSPTIRVGVRGSARVARCVVAGERQVVANLCRRHGETPLMAASEGR